MRLLAAFLVLLALAGSALAISDPAEMLPNQAQEQRAETIGRQLRCLVCQNEDIEDSGADLARDLRRIVREQVAAGKSDQQVTDWMVARYGNFVRLRPPFDAFTLALWGMPVIALLAGFGIALLARRPRSAPPPLSEAEQARISELTRT
jgi:cytochrome c-type biogenesis protein CcmH